MRKGSPNTVGIPDPCHHCGTPDAPGAIHAECRACRHLFCPGRCLHDHSCGNYRTIGVEEQSLLNAIIAAPDDDAPRLIYADFLEDLGTEADIERAAYIRSAIRYNLSNIVIERQKPTLWIQLWWGKMYPESATAVPIAHPYVSWTHTRGLIESVDCSLEAWEIHGPALIRRQPIRYVRINDKRPFGNLAGRAAWFSAGMTGQAFIPRPIANYLPAGEVSSWTNNHVTYYGHPGCFKALSTACLVWARAHNETIFAQLAKTEEDVRSELIEHIDPTPTSAQSLRTRLPELDL